MRPTRDLVTVLDTWLRTQLRDRGGARLVPPLVVAVGVLSFAVALDHAGVGSDRGTSLPSVSAADSRAFLSHEQSFGPVQRPSAIAVDVAGFVYVVDSELRQVTVFRPDGSVERTLGAASADAGPEAGTLVSPLGVAVSSDGRVYVSDLEARRILMFGPDGRFTGPFAEHEIAEGTPGALLFHDGNLYVCDIKRQVVLEFDPNGRLLRTIASDAALSYPNGVWAWPDGAVTIADTGNNRLVEVDADGVTARTIEADLLSPRGLSADARGHLFVTSTLDHRVVVIERTGTQLAEVTAVSGQALGFPTGVAVSGDSLYVTDRAAAAVHRWRINAG